MAETLRHPRGRRTKDADNAAQEFLLDLPRLSASSKESDVIDYVQAVTDAHLRGILSGHQLDLIQKSAAIILRAIRQRAQRSDIEELQEMMETLDAAEDAAGEHSAAERGKTR